jgi:hypothetical protein
MGVKDKMESNCGEKFGRMAGAILRVLIIRSCPLGLAEFNIAVQNCKSEMISITGKDHDKE